VKRFIVVPALVIALFGMAMPQDVTDLRSHIKRDNEQQNTAALLPSLHLLQTSDPKAFAAGDYDYLLARSAESEGQLALAMHWYQAVANRHSVLKPYALAHLSQIARSTGNPMLERMYLQHLIFFKADSLLAGSAHSRLALNYFEAGNFNETIRSLKQNWQPAPGRALKSESNRRLAEALLGKAFVGAAETSAARNIFDRLLKVGADGVVSDDASLTAAESLDQLDTGPDGEVPRLAEQDHFRRAEIYHAHRDLARARLHLNAVVANFPTSPRVPEAIFQTGRTYVQESDFTAAVGEFERVRERYPETTFAKDALLHAASAYARIGKPREAVTRYQQFIEQFPGDDKLDRAYMNIVDVLRDHGEDMEALRWCGRARQAFGRTVPGALAVFAEVRIYIAKENWQSALTALDELRQFPDLGGAAVPGGTSAAEITFLRGFVLEQLSRYGQAIDEYLSLSDGREEYYGWRATERLGVLRKNDASRSYIDQRIGDLTAALSSANAETKRRLASGILRMTDSDDLRERASWALRSAMAALPRYAVPTLSPAGSRSLSQSKVRHGSPVDELLELGLFDEAAPELENMRDPGRQNSAITDYELARYFNRGGRGDRAIAFIEPLWRKVPDDYPISLMPREHLELLYPVPFTNELLLHSDPRGVDPRLMLAVMRQESRFVPDARSAAGARGLMQFIGQTARRIAGELGMDEFDDEYLDDPSTSILFGSQYVADLFEMFPGKPEAVVASYNGGEDNMKRWLTRSRSGVHERYVPEIAYAQSKDYVYKVMANYRMYQHLYDEQLKPR
jgi:soluble lytic murein transglycosylase